MGRLIDADAAIDALRKEDPNCGVDAEWIIRKLPSAKPEREQAIKDCRNCKNGRYSDHYGIRFCYESDYCAGWKLWKPKDIEPERKKGRWQWLSSTYEVRYQCSVCHHEIICRDGQTCEPWRKVCPSCGADMR